MRTDQFRPSVIDPTEFEFVAVGNQNIDEIIGGPILLRQQRELIESHMKQTGGTWSKHSHGGSCFICGAWFIYYCVFYHQKTNTYHKVGFQCTEKLDFYETRLLDSYKTSFKNALAQQKGKQNAQSILEQKSLGLAYEIYTNEIETDDRCFNQVSVICDIVHRLVKYGKISDKQISFLRDLLYQVENYVEYMSQRDAELNDVKEGRYEIRGTVQNVYCVDGDWGIQMKMVLKTEDNTIVIGSVPSNIISAVEKDSQVQLTATVVQKRNDPKIGYFSRPAKAKIIN